MANALALESSPYLRQHAENPVDWLPWGPKALALAHERNVPVLVSIGYSACHWCHVMERESFEDEDTARQMNELFVCVKVDREERPDVDALYMEAVQGMTGHGGWPLNVFLTPEGLPFYGGTYFPPEPRPGMPSFRQVLLAIGEAWRERGEEILSSSEQMRERLVGGAALRANADGFDQQTLERAVAALRASFDSVNGGFGGGRGGPQFPQASAIEFLLCREEREMSLYTLRSMAGGGIHDQVGGGFHRYAVDATWTVPHFEKMLYDNALLARAYLHGAQLGEDSELLDVAVRTLDWMLRELRGPEGGFYAALDADSEGVEGRYYVWTVAELRELLGGDAEAAIRWLGVGEDGNFRDPHHPQPGLNVLEDRGPRPNAATRERIRTALLSAREQRTRPGLDDKRLTAWNALAIAALAETGAHLLALPAVESMAPPDGEPAAPPIGESVAQPDGPRATGRRYLDAASACAEFVLRDLRVGDWTLLRTYSAGQAKVAAYLEDYAFLLEALLALFEATCKERWLTDAQALADALIERFADREHGGFFSTAADGEALIARRKELEDSPIPAGGSAAALGLLRLAQLTGDQRYEQASAGAIALVSQIAPRHPGAFGHVLQAMHWTLAPMRPLACALPARAGGAGGDLRNS
ncbi:MAG TPA: thioredoxin domain-containing protein [Solirubrobacteraceae bacterium]|nr:thioredoxin domain-containing protein [Solirubrobacteraceae bacterium]